MLLNRKHGVTFVLNTSRFNCNYQSDIYFRGTYISVVFPGPVAHIHDVIFTVLTDGES